MSANKKPKFKKSRGKYMRSNESGEGTKICLVWWPVAVRGRYRCRVDVACLRALARPTPASWLVSIPIIMSRTKEKRAEPVLSFMGEFMTSCTGNSVFPSRGNLYSNLRSNLCIMTILCLNQVLAGYNCPICAHCSQPTARCKLVKPSSLTRHSTNRKFESAVESLFDVACH